jgi:hypothetical protein
MWTSSLYIFLFSGFELIVAKYKKIMWTRRESSEIIKIHCVNMFYSRGYILIIIILLSAQKCRFYVNSLIAACKQEGGKSKNSVLKVDDHRFPEVLLPSFSFLSSLVFELEH